MEENNVDKSQKEKPKPNRRLALPLLIVALVVLVVVGWLAVQRFLAPGPSAPAPTPTAAPELTTAMPPPAAQLTPTPTRVLVEAGEAPIPQPTPTSATSAVVEVSQPVISELVRNGGFEAGFEEHNLGLGWSSFHNGSAIFEFLDETWPPAVFDGEHAQRIQVREASQPDRHAGIYQTVDVIPGETYELSLYGQIRTGEGSVRSSQYGYRVQLGIDYEGGQDWTAVGDWIELPWDEQRFNSDFLFFYDYITPVVATDSRLTLFIRTWNKWADPGQVEYTLDAISLRGPAFREELAFDEPLPETGGGSPPLSGWVRVLASVVVLALLVAGAIWQVRRQSS